MSSVKQSNQQRVNEIAKKNGVRIERFNGYLLHTDDGVMIANTMNAVENVLKNLQELKK
jgi:hypothetical protein